MLVITYSLRSWCVAVEGAACQNDNIDIPGTCIQVEGRDFSAGGLVCINCGSLNSPPCNGESSPSHDLRCFHQFSLFDFRSRPKSMTLIIRDMAFEITYISFGDTLIQSTLFCVLHIMKLRFDDTDVSAVPKTLPASGEVFFQKLIDLFSDILTRYIYYLIIKTHNFRGDLSGISAKTATLLVSCVEADNSRFVAHSDPVIYSL